MSGPLLAYYGDDFTGSTDALEFLTRAGAKTVLFTGLPTSELLGRFGALDAIGVAGCTRAMPPREMEDELSRAFGVLRGLGARHVHYKVCSTFDSSPEIGSIGRAIDVGAAVFGGRFVPLVVGAPRLGRYGVFGHLFARFGIGSTGAIHRLDRHPVMSRHPSTPMNESDLRLHLGRQTTKRIGLVDILALDRPAEECAAALRAAMTNADIVLFDVLQEEHLARIGTLLEAEARSAAPLFSVGSSAIEMALGHEWQRTARLQPRTAWEAVGPAQPLLVVSGSCSGVTLGQIRWATTAGFAEVALPAAAIETGRAPAVAAAIAHLHTGRHVIVHTDPAQAIASQARALPAAALGRALGEITREIIASTGIRRLLVAGGDTSSYAARALGIEAVEMIAPLAPGAPLCRAHAPGSPAHGLEVNFKGGQVGAVDYFGAVARGAV